MKFPSVTVLADATAMLERLDLAHALSDARARSETEVLRDALIGSVSQVFQGTNELQTSVSVRPAVDFSSLEYVMVLTTSSSRLGSGG